MLSQWTSYLCARHLLYCRLCIRVHVWDVVSMVREDTVRYSLCAWDPECYLPQPKHGEYTTVHDTALRPPRAGIQNKMAEHPHLRYVTPPPRGWHPRHINLRPLTLDLVLVFQPVSVWCMKAMGGRRAPWPPPTSPRSIPPTSTASYTRSSGSWTRSWNSTSSSLTSRCQSQISECAIGYGVCVTWCTR